MIPDLENIGLRWRQMRFNPLRSLTPEKLANALDGSAAGWLREAALIYEAIETREAIVRSVMTKRRSAVARRDWQVIVPDKDHPQAEAHKATLEYFYNNLTVTDATDLNVRSGMSGLLRQMMDAVVQKYAVHEIVWKPGEGGLSAELRRVPLYFFENRTGRLRYIGPETRVDGMPLDEDGWMITVADGLGEALSICSMFKRLAVQDWLAFSEKFSIPGVMGRTSHKKGTPEANAVRDSVLDYASEWVGVFYGDDGTIKDPLQIIQTPSGSALPQQELARYMDSMISCLVRGGDLSTLSAQNQQGASLQGDEGDALLEDDCAMVSETLQTQLDRLVIRMVHGDENPAAYIVINPPSNDDLVKELAIDEGLVRLGVVQDAEDLAERYGREVSSLKSETLNSEEEASNARDEEENLQGLREALAEDMRPIGDALFSAINAGDHAAVRAAARKLEGELPDLLESGALSEWMAGELEAALTFNSQLTTSDEELANSGNSDGAVKGWETRRANGWVPAPRLITPEEADAELDKGFFVPNRDGAKIRFGAELKRKLDDKVLNTADRNARKQRLRWAKLAVSDGTQESSEKNGNTRTLYAKTFRKGPKHQDVEVVVDTINGYAWNIMVKGGSPDAIR